MKEIKYHSIGQYRNVIRDIQYHYGENIPESLNFTGTVKVHGTNASVIIDAKGFHFPQSKNNIIDLDNDNCGFARWSMGKAMLFTSIRNTLIKYSDISNKTIVIYGEWAGKGIQKRVAVCDVDKFFYIFGVKVINGDSHYWLKDYPLLTSRDNRVVDSREVYLWNMEIDFNNPAEFQNQLIEITNNVEKECPVGKYFGVEGIGEGVVWEYITDEGEMFYFKVKGEKHSISKVKKLASVDVEKLESIKEFVSYSVTENRLNQAFNDVCNNEPDRKFLGAFIKWVSSDINKEESDVLLENNLTMKDVGSLLSKTARTWFFAKETDVELV